MGQIYSNRDFVGLMGSTEMECAVARIVNLSNIKHVPFARVQFIREDFNAAGYDRDGFDQLLQGGWLEQNFNKSYSVGLRLVDRIRKRFQKMRATK